MARWAAIVGPRGSGVSQVAADAAKQLRTAGVAVGGFLQVGVDEGGEPRGHDLRRIATGEQIALSRPTTATAHPAREAFCSYDFNPEAFALARSWIETDAPSAEVLVIDEVSKLEAARRGHHAAIASALALPARAVVVLCVRADQLFYVVERFGLETDPVAMLELPSEDGAFASFVAELRRAVRDGGA